MNKVVQRGAASAEESSSASEEMYAQAEQMKGQVKGLIALIGGDGNGVRARSQAVPGIEGKLGTAPSVIQATKSLGPHADSHGNTRKMIGYNAARNETRVKDYVYLKGDESEEF
jgi:methyl-accepting chemotaxis protein